jgi:hypothetical protein
MNKREHSIEDIERLAAKIQGTRDANEVFELARDNADAMAYYSKTTMRAFFTIMAYAPVEHAEEAMHLCARYKWTPNNPRIVFRAALKLLSRAPLTPALFNDALMIARVYSLPNSGILSSLLRHARDMPKPSEAAAQVYHVARSAIESTKKTRTIHRSGGGSGGPGVCSYSDTIEKRVYRNPVVVVRCWKLRNIAWKAKWLEHLFGWRENRLDRKAHMEYTQKDPWKFSDFTPKFTYFTPIRRTERRGERRLKRAINRHFGGPV